MVVVVQLVRISVCGSEGRGFESHHPPKSSDENLSFFCFVIQTKQKQIDVKISQLYCILFLIKLAKQIIQTMKIKFLIILLTVCISISSFSQSYLPKADPASQGLTSEGLGRLSNYLEQSAKDKKVPGSVTVVVRNGKVVFEQASGKANLETGEAMRMDHLFRMASMSKFITTVAALKLFERGLFTMDTPLETFLPEFANQKIYVGYNSKTGKFSTKPAKNKILMKHVFTHTSGIVYPQFVVDGREGYLKANVVAAFPKPNAGVTLEKELKKLAKLPLRHEPGESWTYGMNMDVLGRVIEVLTGKNFPQFMREEIFQPLKMNRTFIGVPENEWKNIAQVYTPTEKGYSVYDDAAGKKYLAIPDECSTDYYKATNTTVGFGGADVVSCAQDYARFLQMIMNYGELDGARIISKKTVEMIESPLFDVDTKDAVANSFATKVQTGLSVVLTPERMSKFTLVSPGTYFWSGYFNTHFWIDRKENMFEIILTQVAPELNHHNIQSRHFVWGSIGK